MVLIGGLVQNVILYRVESQVDPDKPYPVKGVDVSAHQKEIDWRGLASEDISFAFIKATEGSSHVDKNFKKTGGSQWHGYEGGGIPFYEL